ncbi:hypothetical protein GUJ93_ZPchr0012g19628 [Zizania palustris]|uniref:Secreted protein n=1 Tax=Zizania palustris TaxID=103762 RepID=A0A8J5WQ80_ZIZPA|nr:hypothetical protein GUJ93_ZPchr0012g19628 [Zizania palustris]
MSWIFLPPWLRSAFLPSALALASCRVMAPGINCWRSIRSAAVPRGGRTSFAFRPVLCVRCDAAFALRLLLLTGDGSHAAVASGGEIQSRNPVRDPATEKQT